MKFVGKVSVGDPYRINREYKNGSVLIDDIDLILEIEGLNKKYLIVVIKVLPENNSWGIYDKEIKIIGESSIERGWGYPEYTPVAADYFFVDKTDVIDIIETYEGKLIELSIEELSEENTLIHKIIT